MRQQLLVAYYFGCARFVVVAQRLANRHAAWHFHPVAVVEGVVVSVRWCDLYRFAGHTNIVNITIVNIFVLSRMIHPHQHIVAQKRTVILRIGSSVSACRSLSHEMLPEFALANLLERNGIEDDFTCCSQRGRSSSMLT